MAPLPPSTLLLRKKQKGSSAVMLLASTNPPTQQLVRFYCDVALLQKAMAKTDCVSQLSIVKRKKLARHCQGAIQN
jgi:hypothetical protein